MMSWWREMWRGRFEKLWNLQLLFKHDIPALVCPPIILTRILADDFSILCQRILQNKSLLPFNASGAQIFHHISQEEPVIKQQLQGRMLGRCQHIYSKKA